MIALVLAAMPFVDSFWARDLGALARELAEDRGSGEERMLFEDLLALATCAPLAPLQQPSPLRELVRVEEARRGTHGTLWDDLLRKDFFRRSPKNPDPLTALRWPDEAERWPAETLLVAEPPWRCAEARPGAGPLAALKPSLLQSLPAEAAARAAYERAVLRYRQGANEADGVEPALLPAPLRNPAVFLRLEAGLDAPDGFVALAQAWPVPPVVMRAAQRLFETGRHEELVALPTPAGTSPMHRHLLLVRALSLHALGRDAGMLDALFAAFALPGPEQGLEPLRALAVSTLAKLPFDERRLALAGLPRAGALDQLTRQAIAAGNYQTARAAAGELAAEADPRWRGQGFALLGEIDWRSGDLDGTSAALAHIFEPKQKLGAYRDPAALQLAQALVVVDAERPDAAAARKLVAQLTALTAQVHLKALPQVEELLAAARKAVVDRGEQPVALGEVSVALPPAPPPAPKIEIELPEPYSLLSIPAQDGSLRDWFSPGGAL